MEPPQAFTQLLDRGISAEVQLAAWCPTMDLLALVTVDGQLHVHRLTWQRLWWTAPEATVTGGWLGGQVLAGHRGAAERALSKRAKGRAL